MPVITALQGHALGGGIRLVLGVVTRLSNDPVAEALAAAAEIAGHRRKGQASGR